MHTYTHTHTHTHTHIGRFICNYLYYQSLRSCCPQAQILKSPIDSDLIYSKLARALTFQTVFPRLRACLKP